MSNITLNAQQTMSSREVASLTGKTHGHVMRDIKKMLTELEIDQSKNGGIFLDDYGREQPMFNLSRELTDCLLTGYSAKMRMAVIKRWHELEGKLPVKQLTYSEALRQLADEVEAKEIAQIERDRAIETKAEIGRRREATAMNTASQAVKQRNALQVELDQSLEWASIKLMQMKTGLKFNWRLLKSAGQDLSIETKDVFDANYGTVKAYHRDVWREAYALDISQQ